MHAVLPKRYVRALREARGIETVGELLRFRPRRFLDSNGNLDALTPGDYVVFVATVSRANTRDYTPKGGRGGGRPRTMLNATVRTGEHELDITFFNAYPHRHQMRVGRRGLFAGKVNRYRDRWQLAHPTYEFLPDEEVVTAEAIENVERTTGLPPDERTKTDKEFDEIIAREYGGSPSRPRISGLGALLHQDRVPVYKEVKGIPSWTLSRAVELTLAVADLPDPLPVELRASRGLLDYEKAWRGVHLPENETHFFASMRRLKYDEAFAMQVALARRRLGEQQAPAVPRSARPGGLLEAFDASLPFTLTAGQGQVGDEISADLGSERPMNRLLQGDVGSGKTVVALRAMLAVIDAGGQTALLAPTEVLAAQHHRSLLNLLGPLAEGGMLGGAEQGTRVALLTGSASAAERKKALLQVASGEAGIVVGTHALLEDKVQFADLGLVVVDEQHRFGVEQRNALRAKGSATPHMLVMTATPIPRTVAMTVFGDMETSVLSELPAGRALIQTAVVNNPRWYERAWERVAEEVAAGRQAYVVCPRIGDDSEGTDGFEEATDPATRFVTPESADGRSVEGTLFADVPEDTDGADSPSASPPMRGVVEVHAELGANPVLANARIGLLHGRMPGDEKDAVMRAFADGAIDVLVSTTVIEVGVDVPNATVMVILDADRFGVSQLHQLRGRVGRGGLPGLCLLVTFDPSEGGRERLDAVSSTTDGFELANLDLLTRREGDVLGERQSGGGSRLQFLRLSGREDVRIIEAAREDALTAVRADPALPGFTDLARILDDHLDPDSMDYLKKG